MDYGIDGAVISSMEEELEHLRKQLKAVKRAIKKRQELSELKEGRRNWLKKLVQLVEVFAQKRLGSYPQALRVAEDHLKDLSPMLHGNAFRRLQRIELEVLPPYDQKLLFQLLGIR